MVRVARDYWRDRWFGLAALQLNEFGEFFYNLFSQRATLPVYLFVSLFVNLQFVSYYFSALNIFQGFSLNFAKTLGRAVDKFLNGSRIISHRQFIFGKQARVCFEATRLSRKTEGVTLPFSRHGRN